ncbi:MAG: 1-deoxy-D-xylulose-5-phosphate synthase N-terminal domain-containing protein [Chloroflexota bacterium]|nr:pyruvate dehydrogenase [Dehalococcoidia bacterium]MDW8254189.1 1-deoxy-D-xylulose-5-phosphate synthase N-terminal domain-containing protein [Chloroflexota bacterium]
MREAPTLEVPLSPEQLAALESIQRRVLWLATNIVHHANAVRPSSDGTKVGGHQASSASMVSILTALYFAFLRAGDRVSVKPHASPAFHAVQYLLGNLDRRYLTTLRSFGGLQAYPSRTKDPDPVDFSTGSVGLGAAAPAFAALTDRYVQLHFGGPADRRYIALVGDAELDEGNVWEAVTEEHLRDVGTILWIVDLNRQSLDRVVPGIRARQLKAIFRDSEWHVVEAKYGRRLQAVFAGPGGAALRQRIDDMSNEEYQAAIRLPGAICRERFIVGADDPAGVERALSPFPDEEIPALVSDLGGHDIAELLRAFQEAAAVRDRPSVVFAYTIKGWGLPIAGHPLNHSALLTAKQMQELAARLGIPPEDEWARFPPGSPEAEICRLAAERLRGPALPSRPPALAPTDIPPSIGHQPLATTSTQETLGRLLVELSRVPAISQRIVTVAPDVAVSTNLGGWINRVGVFSATAADRFEPAPQPVRWQPGPQGQHIELGISEMNLFLLLGQLGLSQEMQGELLLPIGTVYDPFVLRGLDAFIYGLYSESKFIVVGTPSGISLSPEGGAHQSTVTPSLGIELPNLISYEPAFAREVEWILLEGLRQCTDRRNGRAMYLRLSTKPVDQRLLEPALQRLGAETLRQQVLAGGYRLLEAREELGEVDPKTVVQIAVAGAMVPEAVEAARRLHREGVAANLVVITSADRLSAELTDQRRRQRAGERARFGQLAALFPPAERRAPIVTVVDGASHALTFLGGVFGAPVVPLGVDAFGQSGSRADLYRYYGIDADAIVAAAFAALDLVE